MTTYCLWEDHDLKLEIIENMQIYGGSFVKALSECLSKADRSNLTKLEVAFENYIEEYHPDNWSKAE